MKMKKAVVMRIHSRQEFKRQQAKEPSKLEEVPLAEQVFAKGS
jgi:hypothetical protein